MSKIPIGNRIAKKTLWYVSIARNAIIVLATSYMAYRWTDGAVPFQLSGHVEPGVPQFGLPPFQFEHRNATVPFLQICADLGSGIVVVPLVAVLANVAIAKAFCKYCTMRWQCGA